MKILDKEQFEADLLEAIESTGPPTWELDAYRVLWAISEVLEKYEAYNEI